MRPSSGLVSGQAVEGPAKIIFAYKRFKLYKGLLVPYTCCLRFSNLLISRTSITVYQYSVPLADAALREDYKTPILGSW